MLEIEYAPGGIVVSDFEIEQWQSRVKTELDYAISTGFNMCMRVSNGIAIDAVRVLVARGEIPHDRVYFVFNDQKLFMNEYGHINDWPEGFADKALDLCDELLTTQMRRARGKSENS